MDAATDVVLISLSLGQIVLAILLACFFEPDFISFVAMHICSKGTGGESK